MPDEPRQPIAGGHPDDTGMAEARRRAVASFKYLWRELSWEYRRVVPALELSVIKAAFRDPGAEHVEHMWLSEIAFDGEFVSATLINSPHQLTSVQAGDQVRLAVADLEDWIYAMHGRVYGGFSVQVLRARMSRGERQQHDEAWGFTFPEPGHVELVPDWTAGATPFDPDAEHPMSETLEASLAAAIDEHRQAFLDLGPHGLNTLHSLALAGSAAGVRVLLGAGADPRTRTRHGKTARELAASLGWPRVVELLGVAESLAPTQQ